MQDEESTPKDVLPASFTTLEERSDFWATHSSAYYEEAMEPVEVEIDLSSSKIYCPAAKDLLREVRRQERRQGVPTEPPDQPLAAGGALRLGMDCRAAVSRMDDPGDHIAIAGPTIVGQTSREGRCGKPWAHEPPLSGDSLTVEPS